MNARHQFVLMERFGHIVVGAEAEPANLVLDAGKAGKDQDRGRYLADTKRFQNLITAHVRQVQVEQDDVVIVQFAQIDPLFTEVGRVHVETVRFEHQFDALRCGAIVFYEQNSHWSPSSANWEGPDRLQPG